MTRRKSITGVENIAQLRSRVPPHIAGKSKPANGRSRLVVVLFLVVFPSLMVLPACLVGPKYSRPNVVAPLSFRGAEGAAEQASLADLPWWEVFQDKALAALVKKALLNNYDLGIAVTRIEQARQIAAQARAQYFPGVGYDGLIGETRNPLTAIAGVGGSKAKSKSAVLTILSAAWEADLWGRIRRSNEAARAQYLATEDGKRAVMLSLVGDVARAYFELLALDSQLEIAKETTHSFDQTLTLFRQRLQGGVASKLDTSRAAAAKASAAASIPEIERQIGLKENQISVLLGQNPGPIPRTAKLLEESIPPNVPTGLPSALLERRPDVLAAEQQVRAANAQIGVATAIMFPQISLSALFGRGSAPVSNYTSGNSNFWNFIAGAAGPIYEGGALKANKRETVAFWKQTVLQYKQTVLSAFQDVSNALISREKYEAIRKEQAVAVQAYEESVKVSLLRYVAGKASYYEVLEAQQQLFPAQNSLVQTELNQRLVIVQLYKALGGGWKLQDAQWNGPQAAVPPVKGIPGQAQPQPH